MEKLEKTNRTNSIKSDKTKNNRHFYKHGANSIYCNL